MESGWPGPELLTYAPMKLAEGTPIFVQCEVWKGSRCFGREPGKLCVLVAGYGRLASIPGCDCIYVIGNRIGCPRVPITELYQEI